MQAEKKTAERAGGAMPGRALDWTLRLWRPAGTVVAVGLALLLTWHVINGKHGLQVWQQKRAEDRQLQRRSMIWSRRTHGCGAHRAPQIRS